jgi:hypothetical protein
MTETSTSPPTGRDGGSAPQGLVGRLIGRITRLEIIVAAVIAAIMLLLVLVEPDILEAPFENWRTVLFTFGGTALAAVAFIAMLRLRVPPVARLIVLVVPLAIVNWWLVSPYFIDDVVDEGFSASISEQLATVETPSEAPATTEAEEDPTTGSAPPAIDTPPSTEAAAEDPPIEEEPPVTGEPPLPSGPVLLGAGRFVGLAGHSGTGFDIQNGPDLEVYLVPGSDQTSLAEGSIYLGALKGNIGDQNYELPPGTELAPGAYTALVWCEAFSVEFVGATIVV